MHQNGSAPYDEQTIADLVDGRLPPESLKSMMSSFKDSDRFIKYLRVLQARVPWSDPILLPLGPHLYIVGRADGARVVRCDCGHEFGDYRHNWKLSALILVRDTEERLHEIYPRMMHADPDWMVLREFVCPGCATLLEVEAVPPGYPIVVDFQPDLEAFYRDWLGLELPAAPPNTREKEMGRP